MTKELTSYEITEWRAYESIDPWGEERADWRAGIQAATVANAHRNKGSRAYKPDDFMPKFGEPEGQTVQEQLEIWKEFAAVHNANLKNGRRAISRKKERSG